MKTDEKAVEFAARWHAGLRGYTVPNDEDYENARVFLRDLPIQAVTYEDTIRVARDLVDEPGSNAEYERGMIELLADTFGKPGVELGERKIEVARELGWSV